MIDKIMANNDCLTQETLILREISSWEDNERETPKTLLNYRASLARLNLASNQLSDVTPGL